MKLTNEQQAFLLLKNEQHKDFISLIQKRSLIKRKPVCDLMAKEEGVSLLQAAAHRNVECANALWDVLSAEKSSSQLAHYVVEVCHDALEQGDIPALRYFLNSGILRAADKEIGRDCIRWPDAFCVVTSICGSRKLASLLPDVYRSGIDEAQKRVSIAVALLNDVDIAKDYLTYGDISLVAPGHVLDQSDEVALFFLENGMPLEHNYLNYVHSPVVADKLIEMGQDIHEQDEFGRTVLGRIYDPKMFRYYVEKYGANVNIPHKNGETILDVHYHHFIGGDFLPETIDLFVKANAACKDGTTAQEISDRMARAKAKREQQKQNQKPVKPQYRLLCAHDDKERQKIEWGLSRAFG